MNITSRAISTILKHDNKQTSYKIALLRSINDVVLSFPDVQNRGLDVAIPLRVLAQFWLAYYWPFVNPQQPIMQGPQANRGGSISSDMAFRDELTYFRRMWEDSLGGVQNPADGYFVLHEMRISRNRTEYAPELIAAYQKTLSKIAKTIQMPIRYAGPKQWTVFEKPKRLKNLANVAPIPGTHLSETCLVVKADLWQAFRDLSLWVEALCIHEWCLFTERVEQAPAKRVERGNIYELLTTRPDNRRPLTWERNHIQLLLMEGHEFICPWTGKLIRHNTPYDLDHVVPISVYPINELWNLVPSDPYFNSHNKRDRLPSEDSLRTVQRYFQQAYDNYLLGQQLSLALRADVSARFVGISAEYYSVDVVLAMMGFVRSIADARNVAKF